MTAPAPRRLLSELLDPLIERSRASQTLLYKPLAHDLPRFMFIGPKGGAELIRIGLFGGIHGDEPASARALIKFAELLEEGPELARDFCLFIYPVCNPTGYQDNTRNSRSGHDLNREFWNNSTEPEVLTLQSELATHAFEGIVALHCDDTTNGVYGFVRGSTLTHSLVEPALSAAELFLPRNNLGVIDGFEAEKGIIRQGYNGILSAPAEVHPRPFEIVFETPQLAPLVLQEQAFIVALLSILAEYRKMISYAANL